MTFKTPAHLERLALVRHLHHLHRSVTVVTVDTTLDVNRVVEVNKVRDLVNLRPFHRYVFVITLTNRLEEWTVVPDLRVTGHTRMRSGIACLGRLLDACVAVATIDTQLSHVVFV